MRAASGGPMRAVIVPADRVGARGLQALAKNRQTGKDPPHDHALHSLATLALPAPIRRFYQKRPGGGVSIYRNDHLLIVHFIVLYKCPIVPIRGVTLTSPPSGQDPVQRFELLQKELLAAADAFWTSHTAPLHECVIRLIDQYPWVADEIIVYEMRVLEAIESLFELQDLEGAVATFVATEQEWLSAIGLDCSAPLVTNLHEVAIKTFHTFVGFDRGRRERLVDVKVQMITSSPDWRKFVENDNPET